MQVDTTPPEVAIPPGTDPWQYLKTATQFTAVIIAAVYGCGFLVVTFAQARLGIVEFSFIRPKVLSAGVTFIFFLALSLFMSFRWFGLFGFYTRPASAAVVKWDTTTDAQKSWERFFSVVTYVAFVYVTANNFGFLFKIIEPPEGRYLTLLLVYMVAHIAVAIAGRRWFGPAPAVFVLVSVSILLTLGTLVVRAHGLGHDTDWLVVWFLSVPLGLMLCRTFVHGGDWRTTQVEMIVPFLAGVMTLYSFQVYPRLKPQFGGGLAPFVVMFMSEKGPLGGPNTWIEARLLDEIEQGYYLQIANGAPAYFIPRSAVAAVKFVPQP